MSFFDQGIISQHVNFFCRSPALRVTPGQQVWWRESLCCQGTSEFLSPHMACQQPEPTADLIQQNWVHLSDSLNHGSWLNVPMKYCTTIYTIRMFTLYTYVYTYTYTPCCIYYVYIYIHIIFTLFYIHTYAYTRYDLTLYVYLHT